MKNKAQVTRGMKYLCDKRQKERTRGAAAGTGLSFARAALQRDDRAGAIAERQQGTILKLQSNSVVIECRSYPVKPFGRDNFIDNFEAHLIELPGTYRLTAEVAGGIKALDGVTDVWFH